MKQVRNILRDLGLALVLGVGIGLALFLAFWVVGALVGGGGNGFVVARSGLMLVGGFTLLFAALLFLKGGNLPDDAFRIRPKPERDEPHPPMALPKLFRVVDRRYTALLIGVGILLVSAVADAVVRRIG